VNMCCVVGYKCGIGDGGVLFDIYSTFLLKLHPSVNRAFPPVG